MKIDTFHYLPFTAIPTNFIIEGTKKCQIISNVCPMVEILRCNYLNLHTKLFTIIMTPNLYLNFIMFVFVYRTLINIL